MAVFTTLFVGLMLLFNHYHVAIAGPMLTSDFWVRELLRPMRLTIPYNGSLAPSLDANFPDPSILQANETHWVAYATNGNGKQIQMATATDPMGSWTMSDLDAMPKKGWTSGRDFWAPDVRRLDNATYIMYFSGRLPNSGAHCIGAARSNHFLGPFEPDPSPLACPEKHGGAIDPAGFKDNQTKKRYVVYKIDGNAKGPDHRTPIKLQEVGKDGTTPIGDAITILDRIEEDGELVEAPNLVHMRDGTYLLFFSSHMYSDSKYDVKYAYSRNIEGPYMRGRGPLISTPRFGLTGPGGMTSTEEGDMLVFHGWCADKSMRCMYSLPYEMHFQWWQISK